MLHNFKVSDASRHIWNMRVIISKSGHSVTVTSPKGVDYTFCWCNGELVEVSICGSSYLAYGKFYATPDSFRKVFSRVPMWLLKKMDFYYKVNIAG